jgi:hypothetical protein
MNSAPDGFRLPWGSQHVLLAKYDRWRKQAVVLKLLPRTKHKLEWVIYYHTKASRNARLTARHFGILQVVCRL